MALMAERSVGAIIPNNSTNSGSLIQMLATFSGMAILPDLPIVMIFLFMSALSSLYKFHSVTDFTFQHGKILVQLLRGYLGVMLRGVDNTFAGTTIIIIFAPT